MLDSEELKNSYHAMIKAVSYHSDHPPLEKEKILAKARMTNKYKVDEYFQEWIDQLEINEISNNRKRNIFRS